ncbi:zinc finger CCCH domain-containing protein 62 isoform X2 [Beta vulgaris subsp. vulgaris]|uniref:zinc finger CCCH domain-containing protein 62 isoform X2 n=2 Tax=Beta vulgaris subsp. vulgaris TaxID=3555 RepID=UPI0020369D7A|nr:zinc finger CCCH domain-containing protein 62 isoform X2 [Beta vulgaris subsp. vulgaris]XP_048495760.1 zinc finger CCCH domain-containing protein 62 isoform X2 [Beta vulgaris subsp. vulgaris]XP_057248672.1 zinc finger CCCH domain-containing protein 62 isoform X2 [Beta vulgaris subsp. vulgaris]
MAKLSSFLKATCIIACLVTCLGIDFENFINWHFAVCMTWMYENTEFRKTKECREISQFIPGTSPSQRSFLYSGSSDGCINFWVQEMSTHYNHGGVLEGHQFAVLCLVALENLVISGSEDATIRIWRRDKARFSHECLAVLEGHRGPVRCLAAMLQDEVGTSFLVYSASLDQTFKVWRVKLLREVKKSSGNHSIGDDDIEDANYVGCEASPVLSPSWVKKKLQCRSVGN